MPFLRNSSNNTLADIDFYDFEKLRLANRNYRWFLGLEISEEELLKKSKTCLERENNTFCLELTILSKSNEVNMSR